MIQEGIPCKTITKAKSLRAHDRVSSCGYPLRELQESERVGANRLAARDRRLELKDGRAAEGRESISRDRTGEKRKDQVGRVGPLKIARSCGQMFFLNCCSVAKVYLS